MGKGWDGQVPGPEYWRECLRVAKPGAHLLAFGGTRTAHRLACAIEDAGWEIRDCLSWLYGSGFPKSHDVSKAIDREAGVEREVIGQSAYAARANKEPKGMNPGGGPRDVEDTRNVTSPATPAAAQWNGWGTALKPAWEPIYLARKPLVGTVASNVLAHGVGGLNVDGCRIETSDNLNGGAYGDNERRRDEYTSTDSAPGAVPLSRCNRGIGDFVQPAGRWPANLCLDELAAAMLGEPSRFFYTAKASRSEREAGINGNGSRANTHPTVKPIALMRWLVRLITPPGGIVLDPFAGSGSTGIAARAEGFIFLGCEIDPRYAYLANVRMQP